MVKRGVVDLAVTADWTPATGDTKVSKDGGAVANTTNNPAIASGASWKLTLTGTELSAKWITVQIIDSATKAVEDQFLTILTYGNASAFFPAPDYQDAVHFGLTALPNAAAGANGGLPLGDGSGRVDVGKALGTAVTLDANNVLNVSTKYVGGTIQTPGDIPARLPAALTANGNMKSSLMEILATALTETAGQLAAGFKKLFNVAAPTAQADNLPLNTDYTAARATKLDNLDATVSSRLATAGYTAPLDAAGTRAAVGLAAANLDTQLATLDADVLSRLSTVGYTAPDNASIAAIKTQTDNLPSAIKKNTALANFPFVMVDSTGAPTTGLAVTATRSIDGAAFGACANAVVEVASGAYKINLAAGDLNGNTILLRFTAAGARDRLVTIVTKP
jgi:hypothetical protein